MKLLNKLISFVKGERFDLDERTPFFYLLCFFLKKMLNCFWGVVKLKRMGIFSIDFSSKIKCVSKIKCGRALNIDINCYVDALSTEGIVFGNNVSIGKNTTIECSGTMKNLGKGLVVGNNVGLGTHGFFGCAGGVEIGDDTIFGNFVSLHSENHVFEDINTPIRCQGVTRQGIKIGRDCWIGAKVTILDGAVIGNGSVVAAGAVVRGEFPPYSVIGGVPAKVLKRRL